MRPLFAAIIASFLFATTAHPQQKPAVAPIPVVKTWKDLQSLTPIDLGDGVKVRLGLEADKIPQWSGALLYCLAEGYTPPNGGKGGQLGPIDVAITAESTTELTKQGAWGLAKADPVKGTYLYCKAIAADRVGKIHIKVTRPAEKQILAQATVEGTKDFFHPWMPWFYLRDVEELAKKAPAKGIALPLMNDMGPVAQIEAGKTRSGNLPTLLPRDEPAKLTIKIDDGDVVIRSEADLDVRWAEFHFLARWWVNDKPYVPKQTERYWKSLRQGFLFYEKELRLPLSFAPELIGAKAGDKIGLQLLYCEREWGWCTRRMEGGFSERKMENDALRLSNRVEFVAK